MHFMRDYHGQEVDYGGHCFKVMSVFNGNREINGGLMSYFDLAFLRMFFEK
ncbi:Hypothetical protein PEIBARAKI_5344 [Petrimonas sp. IBARAKI]|jgi:hypothetical protein|nr:Hypothetical protein PEIBARAKI_5344 [Petrimonas sp. IBARAKI]